MQEHKTMNVDWATIKPLTEHEALFIVNNYFKKHGYNPQRISTKSLPTGKQAPDLRVVKDSQVAFLCEVKTPQHILNEATRMYHWDTTFNKLRRFIHKASKQFNDLDKNHQYPRIVVFTSNHPQLNWAGFQHNILGVVKFGDQILKDYRSKTFVIGTNNDIQSTDAYLWMQVDYLDRRKIYELAIYVNQGSNHSTQIREIAQNLTPNPTENICAPKYSAL